MLHNWKTQQPDVTSKVLMRISATCPIRHTMKAHLAELCPQIDALRECVGPVDICSVRSNDTLGKISYKLPELQSIAVIVLYSMLASAEIWDTIPYIAYLLTFKDCVCELS